MDFYERGYLPHPLYGKFCMHAPDQNPEGVMFTILLQPQQTWEFNDDIKLIYQALALA